MAKVGYLFCCFSFFGEVANVVYCGSKRQNNKAKDSLSSMGRDGPNNPSSFDLRNSCQSKL